MSLIHEARYFSQWTPLATGGGFFLRRRPTTWRNGAMSGERWFGDEELREMARPTMERAIEALDAGDVDGARRLCEEMKHEWRYLHDLMAGGMLSLVSFVQER